MAGYYYESGSGPNGEDGCILLTADMKADRSRWHSWCADRVWRWVEIIGGTLLGVVCFVLLVIMVLDHFDISCCAWWDGVQKRRKRRQWQREAQVVANAVEEQQQRMPTRAGESLGPDAFVPALVPTVTGAAPAAEAASRAGAPPAFTSQPQLDLGSSSDGAASPPPTYSVADAPIAAASSDTAPPADDDTQLAQDFYAVNACVPLTMDAATAKAMRSAAGWSFTAPQRDVAKVVKIHGTSGVVTFYPQLNPDRPPSTAGEPYGPRPHASVNVVTNLPVPLFDRTPRPLYAEFKVDRFGGAVFVSVGLVTLPHPSFRRPGRHDWSVALDLWDGRVRIGTASGNSAHAPYAVPCVAGDVVGVMVGTDGCVGFSRNGVFGAKITATTVPSPRFCVVPCIAADGFAVVTPRFKGEEMEYLPAEATDFRNAVV
ncbi:hypothetical protein H9P43_006895 [Blastocladiella emersonii ATCC 22665]|nr:hypothetical protein H9P43_006895 [Blastocladiella emersonii ATCC 22665]